MSAPVDRVLEVECDGNRRRFVDGEVCIGRGPDNDVIVAPDDLRVSRAHAVVRRVGARWTWIDRSSGGSFVDGRREAEIEVVGELTVSLGAPDGPTVGLVCHSQGPEFSDSGPSTIAQAAAPQAVPELRLSVEGAETTGIDGSLVVGRDLGCDLVVDDDRVSRQHLRIDRGVGGWTVRDLSTNGTYLASERLEEPLLIDTPTVLHLGSVDGPELRLEPSSERSASRSDRFPRRADEAISDLIREGSVLGSLAGSRPVHGTVRIGRATDNDVVIDDLTVSRHHAELRTLDDGVVEIVDLRSRSGTFVDGRRVHRAPVSEGMLIGIGRQLFVLRDGLLDEYVDDGVHVDVRDLTVAVPGRTLLDGVTFSVEPGQLVAVVGPSGAGKSTLMRSLIGAERQAAESVRYNGRSLRASVDELRYRIGYVPQDDILHTGLELRSALRFAADLRFADDVTVSERDRRVDDVLNDLGLSDRAGLAIDRLSGGQRKRASVGLELLTRPALLLLDEPTSGLDPGFERSVMELLRGLADEGHTVIVITHAVASLDLCDRSLFLAPGGQLAFFGPPEEALAHFGADDYAVVFQRLEAADRDWTGELRAAPAWDRWVDRPGRAAPVSSAASGAARRPKAGWWSQVFTLSRRGVEVLRAGRGQAALLLLQAPVIGLLLLVSLGTGNLSGETGQPRALLTVLVLAATAMGLVNSCREIVRESAIYQRERTVGLSLSAYLVSKFVILGALTAVQTVVLVAVVIVPQNGPPGSVLLSPPVLELTLVLFLTTLCAVSLGLAVSAVVKTDSSALVMIPVLIVAQLVFSNAFLDVASKPMLSQVAWAAPGYWGMRATAESSDVLELEGRCPFLEDLSSPQREALTTFLGKAPCPETWESTTGNLVGSFAGLVLLTLTYAGVAALVLRRRDVLH